MVEDQRDRESLCASLGFTHSQREVNQHGGAESNVKLPRRMDWLEEKGYPLQYLETADGHSWGNWRGVMADMLRFFFG